MGAMVASLTEGKKGYEEHQEANTAILEAFMGGIENRAVDFEGWTDENCDAVVRRVCEECGNKYFIPCIAQGGPGSVYPGVYKSLCDSIDKLNEEKFGIKASESTRLPWQIMF